mmetsp:Transcript_14284/g.34819  ORF Transcript_14284/g.34819 Transcript_14284/m.34819 type:complete len:335 (-) Transcript_14284:11-1015(-)
MASASGPGPGSGSGSRALLCRECLDIAAAYHRANAGRFEDPTFKDNAATGRSRAEAKLAGPGRPKLLLESLGPQGDEAEQVTFLAREYKGLLPSQQLELVRAYKGLDRKDLCEAASELEKWNKELGYQHVFTPLDESDTKFWKKCVQERLLGTDLYGHPITYYKMSEVRLDQIAKIFKEPEDVTPPFSRGTSALKRLKQGLSEKKGYLIRKHSVIVDLSGLSMFSFARHKAYAKALTRVPYLFFPDHVYKIYLVNPTTTFKMIWAIGSLWVDPVTMKFIVHLGTQKEALTKWKDHGIPLESVPKDLGGLSDGINLLDLAIKFVAKTDQDNKDIR